MEIEMETEIEIEREKNLSVFWHIHEIYSQGNIGKHSGREGIWKRIIGKKNFIHTSNKNPEIPRNKVKVKMCKSFGEKFPKLQWKYERTCE